MDPLPRIQRWQLFHPGFLAEISVSPVCIVVKCYVETVGFNRLNLSAIASDMIEAGGARGLGARIFFSYLN